MTGAGEEFEYSDRPEGGYQYWATVDAADGTGNHVITDHLALMYDLIMNSMDMGSGFLDFEDHQRLGEIGRLCGFRVPRCNSMHDGLLCAAGWIGHEGPHSCPNYRNRLREEVTW